MTIKQQTETWYLFFPDGAKINYNYVTTSKEVSMTLAFCESLEEAQKFITNHYKTWTTQH